MTVWKVDGDRPALAITAVLAFGITLLLLSQVAIGGSISTSSTPATGPVNGTSVQQPPRLIDSATFGASGPNGTGEFTFATDRSVMATDGTDIFIATPSGGILVVDPVTRTVLRSAQLFDNSSIYDMAFIGNHLYVATGIVYQQLGAFGEYQLDPNTLQILASFNPDSEGAGQIIGAGGYVYFGNGGAMAYQCYPNLTLVKKVVLPHDNPSTSLGPVIFDGSHLWWSNFPKVIATDLNLSVVATGYMPSGADTSSFALLGGSPYVADVTGHVYALSMSGKNVTFTLSLTLPSPVAVVGGMQIVNGTLLVPVTNYTPITNYVIPPPTGKVMLYSWPSLQPVWTFVMPNGLPIPDGSSELVSVSGVPYVLTLNTIYRVPLSANDTTADLPRPTSISLAIPENITSGHPTTFVATLTDSAGNPVYFGEIDFFVDGAQIGKGFTDASGRVFINYIPPTSGTEQLLAVFVGIEQYEGYAQSSTAVSIQIGP